jgi:serine/threonine protein kinase
VLHQIGAGALGLVFRAYEPDRDRLVAVKLFRLDLPPERVHKLVAEFEQLIAADLKHPAIATPLATGIDGVNAYLAQDYVTAESLDISMRENGPATVQDVLRVAASLAEGLDFAAARQILHGALHPRDVLISPDELRLVGLGVTRALECVGVTAPVRRPYTAPERINGGIWDRRADVFSLAAIMHELICGRRLAGTGAQAADAIPETAGGNLAKLRDVFACALADDMSARFATATEFSTALSRAFDAGNTKRSGANLAPGSRRSQGPRAVVAPRLPLDDEMSAGLRPSTPELSEESDLALRAPVPARYQEIETPLDDLPVEMSSSLRAAAITPEPVVEPKEPLAFWEAPQPREPLEPREPVEPLEPREGDRVAPTFAGSFLSPPAPVEPSGLSLVWPLALAAIVGSALGFGAGYAVAIRDRPSTVVAGNSGAPASAPAGREFTEGTVEPAPLGNATKEAAMAPKTAATDTKLSTPAAAKPAAAAPATRSTAGDAPAASKPLFAGRVLVRSTPPGARVFVDGRSGGETPATVRDLARGAHQVRLVLEGYTTVERRIVITASQPALALNVPMPKVPVVPTRLDSVLVVESRPAGATVFLDGRDIGKTPLTLPSVPVGVHAVRMELDGYRKWSASIQVLASNQNRVAASLER